MAAPEPHAFPRDDLAKALATATVQVVFAYRRSATQWDLARLPLHGGLQEAFRARAEAAAVELRDERTGRAYDPQWHLDTGEFFHVSNQPPIGGDLFAKLASFATAQQFKDRRRLRQPNAWIVVAQLDDGSIAHLGARITAKAVLDRNSKILRVVYREDGFDALDDTVITFGEGFDWIAWQNVMIVLNATNFHAMFRDIPALVAQVDANIASVTQHVAIENLDELRARIKSFPGMMVKLQGIVDRADMHTRPPDVLRNYAAEYDIDIDWDGDSMIFDGSVERQWNILRLLDEARTLGPVTGKHWDTSSKTQV
jgi:Kiwa KwaB-like protein